MKNKSQKNCRNIFNVSNNMKTIGVVKKKEKTIRKMFVNAYCSSHEKACQYKPLSL